MPKSLGWKRFDNYSIAVPDARKAIEFHKKLFGLEENHPFTSEEEGYHGAVLDMPKQQGQIEILAPYGDNSFLSKYLDDHGPGVHHVTIEVEDIEQAAAYLREELGIVRP